MLALPMRLAIVVPTLNEEGALRRHLPAALAARRRGRGLGRRQHGRHARRGPRARRPHRHRAAGARRPAHRGAEATDAPLLLFLHADTLLPPDGVAARPRGRGRRRGRRRASSSASTWTAPMLRLGERLINCADAADPHRRWAIRRSS